MFKPYSISDELRRKLSSASFVGACLVVALHIYPNIPQGTISSWIYSVVMAVAGGAVPLFFCISGFLFAGRFGTAGWWRVQMKKRFFSLVVPLVIWCAAFYLYKYAIALVAAHFGLTFVGFDLNAGFRVLDVADIFGLNLLSIPTYGNLWFLRDLIVIAFSFCLLAPLVSRRSFLCGLIVLLIVLRCSLSEVGFGEEGWMAYFAKAGWIDGYLWFSLGVLFRGSPFLICSAFKKAALAVALFVILLMPIVPQMRAFNLLPQISAVVLIWLTLDALTTPTPPPLYLCEMSFPLYLIHGYLTLLLTPLAKRIPEFYHSLCGFTIVYFAVLMVSQSVAFMLRRTNKRLAQILFGGR